MARCPHDNIVYCPLYVAGHDAKLLKATCVTGDWQLGCSVERGKRKYGDLVAVLFELNRRLISELVFLEDADRLRQQRSRNRRAAGLY